MNFLIKKHYYILYFSIIGICFLLNSVLPFYLMLCYLIVGNLLIVFFNKVQSDEIRIFNFSRPFLGQKRFEINKKSVSLGFPRIPSDLFFEFSFFRAFSAYGASESLKQWSTDRWELLV